MGYVTTHNSEGQKKYVFISLLHYSNYKINVNKRFHMWVLPTRKHFPAISVPWPVNFSSTENC